MMGVLLALVAKLGQIWKLNRNVGFECRCYVCFSRFRIGFGLEDRSISEFQWDRPFCKIDMVLSPIVRVRDHIIRARELTELTSII